MKRKLKLYLVIFSIIILSITIIYQIISFRKHLIVINNTLYSSLLPKNNFKSTYTPKINFADRPVTQVYGVTLNILNETKITNVPILLKAQRYYIPLNFICDKLNYTIDTSANEILLYDNDNKISLTENSYNKNSRTGSLRGNLINSNGSYYISISDIEELFNLTAIFDFKNNSISLVDSNVKSPETSSILYTDKIALIRLEDFGCGGNYSVDKNQTKIKCMANLLYSQRIKFHVSWIPRFVSPPDNIDNDLLTNDNIANVGFVNLIDYLINKGAEMGLHGYTHQHGDEISGKGEELSKDINNTEAEARSVIEKGIDTANALNIPISYYESPHYFDTELQKKVIADYFQFIYEPFNGAENMNIYKFNDHNLFVPTPLGYVHDSDSSSIIDGLNNKNHDTLHSFYYHPFLELKHINFNTDNNKLNATFDDSSPLQEIVNAINSNGYVTVHIDELIDK